MTKKSWWCFKKAALLTVIFLLFSGTARAVQVEVAWTAVTAPEVTGYKIYYGLASKMYTTSINAGKQTTYTIPSGFEAGKTYYFAVTAYAADNRESAYSNEVSVAIPIPNVPPVAQSASYSIVAGSPLTGSMKATDADGNPLSYAVVSYGANFAEFTWTPEGGFRYLPAGAGEFVFAFTATDGKAVSAQATVTVTITAANKLPVAVDDSAETEQGVAVLIAALANDSDADNDPLSIAAAGPAQNGTVVTQGNQISYTSSGSFTGGDSFTYRVSDGKGGTASATVTVKVIRANHPPVAFGTLVGVVAGGQVTGRLRAEDQDGDNLTFQLSVPPAKGTGQLDSVTGQYTYQPRVTAPDVDSLIFRVSDGRAVSNDAVVDIAIVDPGAVITREFGSSATADYPGSLADTDLGLDDTAREGGDFLALRSWSAAPEQTVASTVLMKARLATIPVSSVVTDARLILHLIESFGESSYQGAVHRISNVPPVVAEATGQRFAAGKPWTALPAGVTWNDIPLGLADIGRAEDAQNVEPVAGFKTWNIREMVQEWIGEPAANNGLLIKGAVASSETRRIFAAAEHADPVLRPRLVVSYAPLVLPGNQPPIADFMAASLDLSTLLWNFNSSGSRDPDGTLIEHAWNFGDGDKGFGPVVDHPFRAAGEYTSALSVMDDGGAAARKEAAIVVLDNSKPANQPPTANFVAPALAGDAPFQIKPDATGSSDPDGSIMDYRWAFGDGATGRGAIVDHTYAEPGYYTLVLDVIDDEGASGQKSGQVTVMEKPVVNQPPLAVLKASPASGSAPLLVQFDGRGSTDSDGAILSYTWSFGDGQTAAGATVSHSYATIGSYTARLSVVDNSSAAAVAATVINVTAPVQTTRTKPGKGKIR